MAAARKPCPQASPKNSSTPMTSVTAAPIRVRMSKILVAPLVYATASPPEITSAAPINVSCPNFMPSPPYPARKLRQICPPRCRCPEGSAGERPGRYGDTRPDMVGACLPQGGVRYGHRALQLTGAAGGGAQAAEAGARSSGGAAGTPAPPWSRRNGG